jgi:hypothetical protein
MKDGRRACKCGKILAINAWMAHFFAQKLDQVWNREEMVHLERCSAVDERSGSGEIAAVEQPAQPRPGRRIC